MPAKNIVKVIVGIYWIINIYNPKEIILNKDNIWIDVEYDPGWLVINIGDMLSECSTGYFPSTSHRVINPKGEAKKQSRYTMPLFLHPRDEVKLSNKYTAKSVLEERLKELGLK